MNAAEHAPRPDADLIAAWRAGDEQAAAELVRRHTSPLARYLASTGADGDELDDMVQEAFFRAFRGIDRFRGRSTFRTWLLTIGANVLKDAWRRRKGRAVLSLEEFDAPTSAENPHEVTVAREAEERLERAIGKLPEMQRRVFLLRAQHGLEYPEIAAALGTSEGAARVHYHHAMKRLKKALA